MTTLANKQKAENITYSPSVNIIRDADAALNYIPTPNAKKAFNQIINDYQVGIRSFNIIGAYGIGKSAFLWAFEKNINRSNNYFSPVNTTFGKLKGFQFIRLVGEYNSLKSIFAKHIGVNKKEYTTNDVITLIDKYCKAQSNANKGVAIVIDEFGKFLEYAAKNNPESELYFIQQLAEYVNDPKRNVLLVTTLHQDFNGYSRALTNTQQNEWDKVKGRLKEITFSEPVEQLLFLVSERLPKLKIGEKDKNFIKLFQCIENSKSFPLKDYFNTTIAERLLPFDILSAATLTLALQKYGQNERSLFSFIESNDQLGLRDFSSANNAYYNIACLYDYLIHNYYSVLTTKYNPHYTQWGAIRTAIERTEGIFNEGVNDALKLVKTIGLLNVFASASARIDSNFLCEYAKYSLKITNPEPIIKQLENYKIIRFVKHSHKYVLFEGTDLDIELAIDLAGNLVEKVTNVVHHLSKHFDFPYISAKAAYYAKGTPRFFEFHLSDVPAKLLPEGEIDGYINLIFSDVITDKEIKAFSENANQAILYGKYKNNEDVRNLLFEIEKIEKVKENNASDRVALRELDNILQHQIKLLNHYIIGNLYSDKSNVDWYFNGKKEKVHDQKSFNQLLSRICEVVYTSAPRYKNEMVNKTRLSGVISIAKKSYLQHLTENWSVQDIGFNALKFPPEKTVYLSLLRETGIHRASKDGYILAEPTDNSFSALWDACDGFLKSTKNGKRNLQDLADILSAPPFKLKKGFIDFWIPTFLFCKRDDFALFGEDGYIPNLSVETLDLVSREPGDYEVKAFDLGGVKLNIFNRYRLLLNQSEQTTASNATFIETIKPFLSFYKELPLYAKQTKIISKRAQALREAIAYSKDPEETFFDNFPKALGFNIVQLQKNEQELEIFAKQLQSCIKEIRTSYDNLINSFETYILDEVVGKKEKFEKYKISLQNRFSNIKKHLLLPHQRVFLQRVNSEIDDRRAWLSSIAQACISKPFDTINDEEQAILFDKFKDIVHELDNLCEISASGFDENEEIVLKLEMTSFVQGLQKNLVRLPKTKSKDFVQLQTSIKTKLSNDTQLNIATLAKLLEELLNNEK